MRLKCLPYGIAKLVQSYGSWYVQTNIALHGPFYTRGAAEDVKRYIEDHTCKPVRKPRR